MHPKKEKDKIRELLSGSLLFLLWGKFFSHYENLVSVFVTPSFGFSFIRGQGLSRG